MAELTLAGLCKGWDFPVIDRLDLTVEEGEFFVIVGPSGIGKTTLLRLVAGLETPDAGTVTVGERDITPLPPYHRNVAMTFESYALYPHLSVFENIASPLRARKTAHKRVAERVHSIARLLQIEALLERRPGEISGGQKQRTALGRTLVADPEVFLLDEPLSHLDAKIRHELREEFHTLEALRAVATLYVTHDYAEALSLGDRVGVMGNGSLVQVGTARELFQQPQHIFVARQLGQPSINTVGATLIDQAGKVGLQADATTVRIELEERDGQRLGSNGHEHVTVGIRPQHLRVLNEGENPASHQQLLEARVEIFEALGAEGILVADVDGLQLTALTSPELAFAYGENVRLGLDTRALHFFDSTSGMRL